MPWRLGRLFERIEDFAEAVAVVDERDRPIGYAAFATLADMQAQPLGTKRRLVSMEMDNSLASLSAYVGVMRAGHVAILQKIGSLAADSRIDDIFHASAIFTPSDGFIIRGPAEDDQLHSDLALLLSSSGSSGAPKLIRLSHGNLITNAMAIAEYLDLKSTDRAITTLPPFYSYGMSVINSHLIKGASLLLDEDSVTTADYWSRFVAQGATSFAGVPYTFEVLERTGFLEQPPQGLRYVTAAGGKLGPEKVLRFSEAIGRVGASLYVMYGQTEASPRMAYLPLHAVESHPASIGQAIPGGELRLLDESGENITEAGIVGELVYSGPNVMMGYAMTKEDLARGRETDELVTGDLATRDCNGLFTIVGRRSRFVKLFGFRIDLDDVERWCQERYYEAIATGDDNGIVVATNTLLSHEAVITGLASKLNIPPHLIRVMAVDIIPRLPNGKPDYPFLLNYRQEPAIHSPQKGTSSDTLSSELALLVGRQTIPDDISFAQAGGDSLNFIKASLLLEERLGEVPIGWERMTMAELAALTPRAEPQRPGIAADVLARCMCILLIVLHHGADIALEGAAAALLLIAGYNFGRLQTAAVEASGPFGAAFRVLRRLVPIYVILMAAYFTAKRDIFLPNLLFYSTFTSGYDDGRTIIGLYWFVETYIWLIVGSCLLVSISIVQYYDRHRNMWFGLGLIAVAVVIHVLVTPTKPNIRALDLVSPIYLFYIFAIGWIINYADSDGRKSAMSLVAILVLVVYPPHRIPYGMFVTIPVTLLLLWSPRIELTSSNATKFVTNIGNSSLYIYLAHPIVFMPLLKLFGNGSALGVPDRVIGTVFLTLPLSVVAGLILHKLVEMTESYISTQWKSWRTSGAIKMRYSLAEAARPTDL